MPIRRLLARVHRWVGLASGIIVFVVSLSGAVYVWEGELFALTHRSLVYAAPSSAPLRASADALYAAAQRAVPPGHVVNRLTILAEPHRSVVAMAQRLRDGAPNYFQEFLYYDEVFLDPGSARVLGVVNRKYEWLYLTRMIHTELLLSDVGTWIVGSATLAFVAMVLVGVVLWWPRNRAVLSTRLRPRLTVGWKRAVFDAHNVLGVYGVVGLLIIALTGPVWTWRWYERGMARALTGQPLVVKSTPAASRVGEPSTTPMEHALQAVRTRLPDARRLTIDIPSGKSALLTVGAVYNRRSPWEEFDRYFFDPRTGLPAGDDRFDQKNLAMRWRNSNYGIHTGTLYGWPSQIAATLVALLAASLPLTGAMIWFPRWRRQRTPRVHGKRREAVAALVLDGR